MFKTMLFLFFCLMTIPHILVVVLNTARKSIFNDKFAMAINIGMSYSDCCEECP